MSWEKCRETEVQKHKSAEIQKCSLERQIRKEGDGMVIERSWFYHLDHYEYGEAFYGSFRSVYYRLGAEPLKNMHWIPVDEREPHMLRAYVWKGPKAFSTTNEEKSFRDFPYTEEGLEEAVRWIDSQCEDAPPLKLMDE